MFSRFSSQLKMSLAVGGIFLLGWLFGAQPFYQASDRALALEKTALDITNEPLPSESEVDALAKVNRLVAQKSLPAVVHIITQSKSNTESHPDISEIPEEWRRFFGDTIPDAGPRIAQGSGVVIDAAQGHILTNSHVVNQADQIQVRLSDGRRLDAKLVGFDPPTDLAVIQITADHLAALAMGDSDRLQVGDPVMTVGNPFGLEGTISVGVVSAKERAGLGIIDYEGFIQTDAVINPGNSGGPLVNMRAEIVGINTAIETRTGTFSGVGFAIPASRIKKVLPLLLKGEKIIRGYLGVVMTGVKDDPETANRLGWKESSGVIVREVVEGSPAEEAGLRENDILINLNGEPIHSSGQLTDAISYIPPGSIAVFDTWRDRDMVSLQVVVGRQPENFSTRISNFLPPGKKKKAEPTSETAESSLLGITVQTLDATLKERYELEDVADSGAVVTEVEAESLAEVSNIKAGDVIVAINGNSVQNAREFSERMKLVSSEDGVDLRIRNNKGSRHIRISLKK